MSTSIPQVVPAEPGRYVVLYPLENKIDRVPIVAWAAVTAAEANPQQMYAEPIAIEPGCNWADLYAVLDTHTGRAYTGDMVCDQEEMEAYLQAELVRRGS
jgi:hypothetical protein